MTKIGDTVWVFDINQRRYTTKPDGGMGLLIYREHFVARKIIGETSRSWIIEGWRGGQKVPKAGGDVRLCAADYLGDRASVYMTADAVNDAVWTNDHHQLIVDAVRRADVAKLRAVAVAVGYDDKAGGAK